MPTGTCERCAAHRNWLHKHHLVLQCDGGTDADGILMLCANCHEDVHGGPMGGDSVRHRRHNPEVNARRAETMRKKWEDPDARARMLNRKPRSSPTAKERLAQSERMRKRWANPLDPLRVGQPEIDRAIRDLREEDMTIEQVAAELAISRHTVMRSLKRTGGDPGSRATSQQLRRKREADNSTE